jgi:alpha/beta superfamily hydrolase
VASPSGWGLARRVGFRFGGIVGGLLVMRTIDADKKLEETWQYSHPRPIAW